ncbi:MAG: AraC family transcriptional regulator [Roseburia sp.]|nr:AraC family transcriptional regulator [Roseburia sp.]MCM1097989.1 AraC family transcriptional regulator [Ruminococcus flavefaciens]
MKSLEKYVDPKSDYFIHSPSAKIAETFLYPICLGHYFYLPGYRQHRLSFDSFLLMYVFEGTLTLEFENRKQVVAKNHFILLDCYQEHCYSSEVGWEAIWIHFDGPPARKMYQMTVDKLGNVFSLSDPLPLLNRMAYVYQPFARQEDIWEVLIAKYLNDILTEFIIYTPQQIKIVQRIAAVENCKVYIQNHLEEDLKIDELAKQAFMSTYYFIRVFKNETGMSPHEYIINTRIHLAKMLLLETTLPVGDICYKSGFSSESAFCAAFKKNVGVTPTLYRKNGRVS